MRENLPEVLPDFPTHVIPEKTPVRPKRIRVNPPGPIATNLRLAAEHMRKYGFQYGFQDSWHSQPKYQPACFLGTFEHAFKTHTGPVPEYFAKLIFDLDTKRVGVYPTCYACYETENLRGEGWNKDDAVAALEIAADIAQCEGV